MTWVTEWTDGLQFLAHRDGVAWTEAPIPARRHRCTAQTRGRFTGAVVERCACGAIREAGEQFWLERNSSKPDPPRRPWWRRMFGGTQ